MGWRFASYIGAISDFIQHLQLFFVGIFRPVTNFFAGAAAAKANTKAVAVANFHTGRGYFSHHFSLVSIKQVSCPSGSHGAKISHNPLKSPFINNRITFHLRLPGLLQHLPCFFSFYNCSAYRSG